MIQRGAHLRLGCGSNTQLIAQLRQEVLDMEGRKPLRMEEAPPLGLGPIEQAFKGLRFPQGTLHEFSYERPDQGASTFGFIAGILGRLTQQGGYSLWVTENQTLFPLGLARFGLAADRVFFLRVPDPRQAAWAIEEALKCPALVAVVGAHHRLSFAASRRLQLAIEQTGVTGFVYRQQAKEGALACGCRWRIQSLPSFSYGAPGLGFPRWQVELTKARTGTPRRWDLEWAEHGFRHTAALAWEWDPSFSQTQAG